MHERILARLGAALLLCSFVAGCAMAAEAPMAATGAVAPEPPSMAAPARGVPMRESNFGGQANEAPADPAAPAAATPGTDPLVQRGPILLYSASLHLIVLQVAAALKEIEAMARDTGGFLARRDDTSIEIRVPAASFDDVVRRLEKLGDVLHRNVVAEDVTEQYMDIAVRLKNARAVRDRLALLLERSTRVEDSLRIEKELTRVSTDIEVLEGKLKYLRDRAQYSTITVQLQPKQTDRINAVNVHLPIPWLDQLGLGRLLQL